LGSVICKSIWSLRSKAWKVPSGFHGFRVGTKDSPTAQGPCRFHHHITQLKTTDIESFPVPYFLHSYGMVGLDNNRQIHRHYNICIPLLPVEAMMVMPTCFKVVPSSISNISWNISTYPGSNNLESHKNLVLTVWTSCANLPSLIRIGLFLKVRVHTC